jgi:hypothetical protein
VRRAWVHEAGRARTSPRTRLDALGPAPRAELLHVLMLRNFERADRIGEFWSYPQSRTFAELLIDCEEDRTLRAVLAGMLREQALGSLLRTPHRESPRDARRAGNKGTRPRM